MVKIIVDSMSEMTVADLIDNLSKLPFQLKFIIFNLIHLEILKSIVYCNHRL